MGSPWTLNRKIIQRQKDFAELAEADQRAKLRGQSATKEVLSGLD
jgi:hypothetical protein